MDVRAAIEEGSGVEEPEALPPLRCATSDGVRPKDAAASARNERRLSMVGFYLQRGEEAAINDNHRQRSQEKRERRISLFSFLLWNAAG
jgi:hypothetical protein